MNTALSEDACTERGLGATAADSTDTKMNAGSSCLSLRERTESPGSMSVSKMYSMDECCWLCMRNGASDPLDRHHIFRGPNRDKSEKYGLVVRLCHSRCHLYGDKAVHRNAETMKMLHEYGQRKAMEENGWSVDDFIREFGRNYIDLEDLHGKDD
ncbi:MAG: hypothetical protein ACI4TM_09965 [Candidatus Cryptobacteroides sp.]